MNKSNFNISELNELPSYKKPPVVEVICGIRFTTPQQLRIHHFGLLWKKFCSEFPNVEHAPHLFSPVKGIPMITSDLPIPRVWFINNTDDQLIQFQDDRFYFNWRKRELEYPRYPFVIKKFDEALKIIKSFFDETNLNFQPIEYELTYINHILKGEDWNEINDFNKIFSNFIWNLNTIQFLNHPIDINSKIIFPLKKNKGSLSIELKKATRIDDNRELFLLEMRTKGKAESNDIDHHNWFDIAHEAIVKGFTELTSPEIHKIWERER